jgi:thymidylate kinase
LIGDGFHPMASKKLKIVSFSGIDGAGKSTQIDALCDYLRESGVQFILYKFWDDVVVLSRMREHMSLKAFKGDKGIGSPEKPIVRRDKNVRSWYMTAIRLALYALDALHLSIVISKSAELGVDFLIFDRYIYDELANLPLARKMARLYLALLLKIIRRPDVAFLIDADPEMAAIRKPEYPLEFVRQNRDAYLSLSAAVGMTVVPPSSIDDARQSIRRIVAQECLQKEVRSESIGIPCSSPSGPAKAV